MGNMFETVAYHKNDEETAYKNILWKSFFISHDTDTKELWLGDGIYFWEKPEDATWWPGGYKKETILSAKLSCPSDQFSNLDEKAEKEFFKEFCRLTKEHMEGSGYSFEFSGGRFQVNSFFYNVFKETYNVLLIKYSFPERNKKPQYCATDNSIVSDIKIVAQTVGNELKWCLL